jgi:hypothetical protein
MPTGNPEQVRVGPGWLYIGPIGSAEPTDLSTAWETVDADWVNLGYTDGGTTFVFDQTFEDVTVDQEYDPILTLQTARQVTVNVQAAELTVANLEAAFNGGTITGPTGGLVTFEPPDAGDYTHVMVGWEATDALERWIFRKCLQVGSVEIGRRKAPDKAVIPLSFRAVKPADATAFAAILDTDYTLGS